jgi:hypothetical protein
MTISIPKFTGAIPRLDDRRLPPTAAALAQHTKLEDGTLRAYRGENVVHSFGVPHDTFVKLNGTWEGFTGVVSVVPGPVAKDRIYIAGGELAPRVRQDGNTDFLGVPAPTVPLHIERLGQAPAETPAPEAITYSVTFVTERNEESAPGPVPSVFQYGLPSTSFRLTNFPVPPADRGINRYRLYRTQTDSLGVTSLFFVKDLPITTVSYTHDAETDPINEEITSTAYDPPPDDLEGLCAMQNGIIAGWAGKDLLFCEPYKPHAWPEAYRLKTDYKIVGLASFGTMLAVLTVGTPYRVQGTQPDRMQMEQIEQIAPCLSTAGIVDMGYAAVYPSTAGLMQITSSGAQIISEGLFDREDWNDLNPETMRAAQFEGGYLYTHTDADGVWHTGLFNLSQQSPQHVTLDVEVRSLWHRIESGRTFGLSPESTVLQFNTRSKAHRPYVWRSSVFTAPAAVNYAAFMIDSEPEKGKPEGLTTVRVYADGALIHTKDAENKTPYRLPSGFRAKEWQIELEGVERVARFRMTTSVAELLETP